MTHDKGSAPILMVDDDKDDRMMTEKALRKNRVINPITFLRDGEELMDYLLRRGKYANEDSAPRPCFILLDLNMPRMDGRRALELLKADPEFEENTGGGADDFPGGGGYCPQLQPGGQFLITKPVTFDALVTLMESLKNYWLEIVELPSEVE